MDGFVIARSFSGTTGNIRSFLDRNKQWRDKTPDEAYVFSTEETSEVLEFLRPNNRSRPEYLIAARYDPVKDTTIILGTIQPAYAVSPVNVE